MAIVHVVMKSSSTAPPAAAHAQYIARDGQYEKRGGLELVESGNMPEFAREDPHSFWQAADDFERKNGRAYTELQIALPRELAPEQRNELAREAARELMGERFAYTLAVHTPLAKDNIEQPHLHLMFSERVVDERTRELGEDRFFKRDGAKKDRAWNERDKPMEVREKWVEMMNAAMERHGQEQRLDHRSWADQGRHDLAELVEPKLLAGSEAEARALHTHVDGLREQRAELPAAHLSPDKVIDHWEQEAERQIVQVREREVQELSRLDQLIAAAKELASAVKEKSVEVAQNVSERMEQLRDRFERWRENRAENADQKLDTQPPSPAQERQAAKEQGRAGPELGVEAQIAQGRQAFRERYEAHKQAAVLPEPKQEQTLEKGPEKAVEKDLEIDRGHGFGIGR